MKPICVPCQRFFRVTKTGFHFIEGMPVDDAAVAGNQEPEKWEPYKIWIGDRFECPGCGVTILSGFGGGPISIQHEDDFQSLIRRLGADQFQVNDC